MRIAATTPACRADLSNANRIGNQNQYNQPHSCYRNQWSPPHSIVFALHVDEAIVYLSRSCSGPQCKPTVRSRSCMLLDAHHTAP